MNQAMNHSNENQSSPTFFKSWSYEKIPFSCCYLFYFPSLKKNSAEFVYKKNPLHRYMPVQMCIEFTAERTILFSYSFILKLYILVNWIVWIANKIVRQVFFPKFTAHLKIKLMTNKTKEIKFKILNECKCIQNTQISTAVNCKHKMLLLKFYTKRISYFLWNTEKNSEN